MKGVRAADLISIFASCLGATPAPMQEMFWQGLPSVPMPLPLLNLICTNVPGSPSALYAGGRRLLASYPQVPTGYELGLGIAVQSYDGKLCFGLTADAHVAADVARLRDYILVSFEELCKAAGVKTVRRRSARSRAAQPRPARPAKPDKAAGLTEPAAQAPLPETLAAPLFAGVTADGKAPLPETAFV